MALTVHRLGRCSRHLLVLLIYLFFILNEFCKMDLIIFTSSTLPRFIPSLCTQLCVLFLFVFNPSIPICVVHKLLYTQLSLEFDWPTRDRPLKKTNLPSPTCSQLPIALHVYLSSILGFCLVWACTRLVATDLLYLGIVSLWFSAISDPFSLSVSSPKPWEGVL